MRIRSQVAAALLATAGTPAMACPDCVGDYAAWLEDQAQTGDDDATKQAFQAYEAQKMADAKAVFLAKFKAQGDGTPPSAAEPVQPAAASSGN